MEGLVQEMAGPVAQHWALREVQNWTNSSKLGYNLVEEFPWTQAQESNSHRRNKSKQESAKMDWNALQMIRKDQLTEVHM